MKMMLMHISRFACGMRKARSNLYRADSNRNQKGCVGVYKLGLPGKHTGRFDQFGVISFSGTVWEQRTASHLVIKCTEYVYRWRKT